jgi:tungstate transport system substrate-binding protein
MWRSRPVFSVLVGPPGDPARLRGTKSIAEAFRRLAERRGAFVSRGDDSGTHVKEQEIWRATGLPLETKKAKATVDGRDRELAAVRPVGDWYFSIGQGMGKTLVLATEKQAYTLSDRATYYALALASPPRTDLVVVREGDPTLFNPYGVIAVNPQKLPHVNFRGAKKYIEWITSPEVQKQIGDFKVGGKVLFFPNAARPQAK